MNDNDFEQFIEDYYNGKIKTYLNLFLTDIETKLIYWINFGMWNNHKVYFEQRKDWGLIYNSIDYLERGIK